MSGFSATTTFVLNKPITQIISEHGLNSGGNVQKYIDSTVLRLSDPYVPFLTGALKTSGTRGTVIGNGEVNYIAPYAARNYYGNAGMGKQGTAHGGLRGREWFERMKCDHLTDIVNGAAKMAGGVGSTHDNH